MSNSVQSSYVPRHAVNEPGHRGKVTNGLMGLAFAGGVVAVAGASTAQAAEVQGGTASHVGHQVASGSSLSNPFGLKQTQGSLFNSAQSNTHRAPLIQTKSATLPLTTASKIRHEVTQRVQADKLQRATTAKTNPDALPTVITNQAAAGGVYAIQTAGDLLAGSFSTTLDGVATIDAAVFEFGPNVAATMIEQVGTAAGQRALVQPVANIVRALGKTNTFADCAVSTTVNSAVHTGVNLVTHGGDIVNGKYSPITYVPSATCKDFKLPPKAQTPCPTIPAPKPCPPKSHKQPCPGKVTWPKLPCPDGMHKPCPPKTKPSPCPTIPPIVIKVPCPTIPFPTNDIPCPGTETPTPGTDTPCPGTETPTPGTDNPKPGTETPKPGTDNPKPGTETPKPGTDNPKPGNPTTPTGPVVQTDNVTDDADETVPLGSLGAAFALAAAGGVVVRRRNQN